MFCIIIVSLNLTTLLQKTTNGNTQSLSICHPFLLKNMGIPYLVPMLHARQIIRLVCVIVGLCFDYFLAYFRLMPFDALRCFTFTQHRLSPLMKLYLHLAHSLQLPRFRHHRLPGVTPFQSACGLSSHCPQ